MLETVTSIVTILADYCRQRFQKEAIYRQMQEYKREKATLESNLNDLKKRSAHHDDHLRIVHAWFSQVSLLDVVCCARIDIYNF